jgi:hypothetical protein
VLDWRVAMTRVLRHRVLAPGVRALRGPGDLTAAAANR